MSVVDAVLLLSPSRKDGIDLPSENKNRILGCQLIAQAGIMLDVPQMAIATGQILFHRFFFRRSMKEFSIEEVAQTCLFIATKAEESLRRPKDFIAVFHALKQYRETKDNPDLFIPTPLLCSPDVFASHVRKIRNMELVVLNELGYMIYTESPHRYLVAFMTHLDLLELKSSGISLLQHSWNYINDSLYSWVAVRFELQEIAVASLFLAARDLRVVLPNNWYLAFEVSLSTIQKICCVILSTFKVESR